MTLIHLATPAGLAMTTCPNCTRRVSLVYVAGELLICQHAMPPPSNERWNEGDACPASGASVGRVAGEERLGET